MHGLGHGTNVISVLMYDFIFLSPFLSLLSHSVFPPCSDQERKPLSSTCPSCHDIDAAGGFISFGEGDVQGCCIYCRRPLMGDLVDFRAFRMRYAVRIEERAARFSESFVHEESF